MSGFWRGRRVLITGHTGFKGGWLSTWLKSLDAEITGYALAPATSPSFFDVARVSAGLRSVIGDIRDLVHLKEVFSQARPEILIHMAAQPLVRASYVDPVETYSTNVQGTVNVLEVARETPSLRAIVVVTSDKVYENREFLWGYRETDSMGGFDPYSSSKGCAELVAAAYRRSFALPIGSARAGNVIGGGDWSPDRLVPDVLKALASEQSIEIRSPEAIRPWQHVIEPLRGYLTLAQRIYEEPAQFSEAWNFGPRDEDCQSVASVVSMLAEAWDRKSTWQLQAGQHPHEARHLKLDSSKARARLGWYPKIGIAEGVTLTAAWQRAWIAGENMTAFTNRQIEQYG